MKISTLIKNLKLIMKQEGDLNIIYAHDDEGNTFSGLHYTPSVGRYDGQEFRTDENYECGELVCCVN